MSNLYNLQAGGPTNDAIITSRETNQTQKHANHGVKENMLL